MDKPLSKVKNRRRISSSMSGVICLLITFLLFGYLANTMGVAEMMKTLMATAHDLLLNTVFFLLGVCVLTGALGRVFVVFGVVSLIEKLLRPVMRPIFNLPGVASLGAVMTFLSDNPAIISLSKDKKFSSYFKKYQLISLTNFGTAFGMGLLVIVFMVGQGFLYEPLVGFVGAIVGCVVSTRLMQRFIVKAYPEYAVEDAVEQEADGLEKEISADGKDDDNNESAFTKLLNALLDGGKSGVEVGMCIIPGVLIISTFVMMFTFGPGADGTYDGSAYQGVELLPFLAAKINFLFEFLFGFGDPHLIGFPITALGAVGAALGLVPKFMHAGWIDGNAIAVFTAIGMCWSGYLSTHTAMLDSLGYRKLTSRAIGAHTIGGIVAAVVAHWLYELVALTGIM